MVEGSGDSIAAGEHAIDLAEYSEIEGGRTSIAYYQLKHSSVRTDKKFAFAEIKKTLKAFAERYTSLAGRNGKAFSAYLPKCIGSRLSGIPPVNWRQVL
jgi:hypothetical protein